jgi:hypothetical protein
MSRIFISYRRDDSAGWTGRLADQLKARFGAESIFIDIDTIEPGADFTEALRKAVGSCDVLLAVIGPRWATVTDKTGTSRLHDPSDWIRVEIAAALARKIRVIPVLVGGATMPSSEFLPDDLDGFAQRQAHELSDKRWTYDVDQLMKVLSPDVQERIAWSSHSDRAKPSLMTRPIVGVLLLVVIGGIAAIGLNIGPASNPQQEKAPDVPPHQSSTQQKNQPERPETKILPPRKSATTIHLAAGQDARLKTQSIDHRYQVLNAELRSKNTSENILHLDIRLTNNDAYPTNFWNRTFRLLENGVPRSPISDLSESVEGHSAKEGIVEFIIPVGVSEVQLRIIVGNESAEIPLSLKNSAGRSGEPGPSGHTRRTFSAHLPAPLASNQEVTLSSNTYTILEAKLDRLNSTTLRLHFRVRLTNNGRYPTNFWNRTFRLLEDGIPRAPVSDLNETVEGQSAKEGSVEFSMPESVQQVVLQIRQGNDVSELPFALPH